MSPRGRPRAFDRDAALDSAMRVFWEHGYDGTSLAELTAAMGIAPPSLYAAFGSKEGLFRAALERYGQLHGGYRALLDRASARESIEAMLRAKVDEFTEPDHPAGCLVVLAATTCTSANRAVWDELAARRKQTAAMIAVRLRRGSTDGDVPPGTDFDALAHFYNTVLHGLSVQARDGADRATLHGVVDLAMAAWPTEASLAR
ncbi:TetR/AcrR family transcriptional regulator [Amycolatopsis suaedae]|uniref:TetR/AcrR family transcriptional regulator n=1 Tax=Amycolatopsis suaedae TaxID=2510978 RepID=A0A4V2EM71_9PSEU|nr:TetR/AcrR family transcriptional regulator [Amycolatopsis suaedae]RZQ64045.1 TetR/AcrR family transcriptional regulator [Amycolatopsis suaedae]